MTATIPPAPAAPPERCPTCGGEKYVRLDHEILRQIANPQMIHRGDLANMGERIVTLYRKCPDCAGTGQRKEKADAQ